MWVRNSIEDVIRSISKNEIVGLSVNIVGILIGFAASQYNPIVGAIIFLTFFTCLVLISIYALSARRMYGGIYEVIRHENIWKVEDKEGKKVTHTKRLKVRFIQNNVLAIEDFIWGDGDFMNNYNCTPGKVVDIYRDGSRTNVLISMKAPKGRGDIETFEFTRTIIDGFLADSEWIEVSPFYRTEHMILKVIFPPERVCKLATFQTARMNIPKRISLDSMKKDSNNCQTLEMSFRNPRVKEVVKIRWDW